MLAKIAFIVGIVILFFINAEAGLRKYSDPHGWRVDE